MRYQTALRPDADPLGNNPIYQNGTVVGRATGGNYGFRLGKSIALGMVRPEHAEPSCRWTSSAGATR